jgi:CDP-4-dehydro-6-deoxyglucose reductase
MPTVSLIAGTKFQLNAGDSILDAAIGSNVTLPYSCKNGRCGTCKCRIRNGKTHAIWPETGLTAQEKADGWILSCVRTAETDVLLESEDLSGIGLPPVRTLPCRISHIERVASDVIRATLRLPPTAQFSFIPGQYIEVIGANGIRRSYSLASSNFDDKVLELHIRAVEGGAMSAYWFQSAKSNDLLRLNGPLGTFCLREAAGLDLIFLATGTGIAPVKSMLESLAQCLPKKRPRSIKVFWGNRHSEDFYLKLDDIDVEFAYTPVQSRPNAGWPGPNGYVQDVLLLTKPDLTSAAIYACGSDGMIRSAKQSLVDAGLPSGRFHSEAFVTSGDK